MLGSHLSDLVKGPTSETYAVGSLASADTLPNLRKGKGLVIAYILTRSGGMQLALQCLLPSPTI